MRIASKLLVTSLVLTTLVLPVSPAQGAVAPGPGRSVIFLRQGQTFRAGQVFTWGRWRLTFSRGDLALFKPNGDLQWESGTRGSGATRLAFQQDGNLVLYTAHSKPVWWTNTYGLGLTHGVLRLFWGTDMGRCLRGQPGGLELSGVLAGGYPSYVWTSCELTQILPNSALSRTSFGNSSIGGVAMVSPNSFTGLGLGTVFALSYQNDGNLSLYRYTFNTRPGSALLWQSHTTRVTSLLFGFNRARNGPALYSGSFNKAVWSESGITVSGLPYRWFALQDDGNFVLYASSDAAHTQNVRAIWDTGTAEK
jgi:hypothetical protein